MIEIVALQMCNAPVTFSWLSLRLKIHIVGERFIIFDHQSMTSGGRRNDIYKLPPGSITVTRRLTLIIQHVNLYDPLYRLGT